MSQRYELTVSISSDPDMGMPYAFGCILQVLRFRGLFSVLPIHADSEMRDYFKRILGSADGMVGVGMRTVRSRKNPKLGRAVAVLRAARARSAKRRAKEGA